MPQKHLPPSPDELEISVFGPGYGESVLIHTGNGVWIVIDSCVDPKTGRSAPLVYLESIGADPSTAIDLVVASHWHADHVRGLHELFLTASSAKFSCSSALTGKEFLSLAKVYSQRNSKIPMGPEELFKCMETVAERTKSTGNSHTRWAAADKCLWRHPAVNASLTALSPSDSMISRSVKFMIDSLVSLKKGVPESRASAGAPNDVAIALLLNINGRSILLGSDLEEEGKPLFGWSAVLNGLTAPGSKSVTYKVAHHGSVTGHHNDVWGNILEAEPLALLTPFRHGSLRIPTVVDRQRILDRTDQAFISANPEESVKPVKRSVKTQAFLNGAMSNRRLAVGNVGHIRWRTSIHNLSDKGNVELFDGAMALAAI